MFYQIIFLTIVTTTNSHTPVNSSHIVIVGGHSDLQNVVFLTTATTTVVTKTTPIDSSDELIQDAHHGKKEEEKEDVVFVPTSRNMFRNDETLHEDTVRMSDVLEQKRPEPETEKPGDVLFIQGKNNERQISPRADARRRSNVDNDREQFRYLQDYEDEETTKATTPIPLDCDNLNCENEIDSICGGKMERSEMKYRLFKNECYFRRVNCGFSYEMNRYIQVDMDYCNSIAAHVTRHPDSYPIYFPPRETQKRPNQKNQNEIEGSRRFAGRRAMIINEGGRYCSHTCPTMCTDDNEPECAVSVSGLKRVFRNHCQLDLNSCDYQMLWRVRPLFECTGSTKADMHQNRAFIDWMQKTGMIDKKGKLVLN